MSDDAPAAAASAAAKREGHACGGAVTCLAALRQPGCFASGGSDGDVCLWAPHLNASAALGDPPLAYTCVQRLRGHAGEVRCLALLDGGALLSGAWDSALRFWTPVQQTTSAPSSPRGHDGNDHDGHAAAPIKIPAFAFSGEWRGHDGPVWALCALRDGGAASAGADATVRLWAPPEASADGPVVPRRVLYGHSEDVCALAALACGARLASGGTDGTVRLWRLADGASEAVLKGHSDSVTALAATRGGGAASASGDRAVRVWRPLPPSAPPPDADALPPQPLPAPPAVPPGPRIEDVAAVLLMPLRCLFPHLPLPGGLEAHGHRGGPGCLSVLQGHAQALSALAALPDGRLVSGGADAALCVWSQAAAPPPGAPPSPRFYDPVAAALARPPDVTAPWRCDRVLQRPDVGGPAAPAHRPVSALAALAYAPEAPALLVAASFGARVRVWDVAASDVAAELATSRDD